MSRKKAGRSPRGTTAPQPEARRPDAAPQSGPAELSPRQRRLAEREAQARRERRRQRTLRGIVLAAAAAAGLVGALRLYDRLTEPVTWQTFADQGNAHLPGPDSFFDGYNSDPPTSGPHAPTRPAWGIHRQPISRPLQVHALEDGGVVVQYSCPGGCPELVEQLASIVRRYPSEVILAPYPGMPHRIALTAWTKLDAFDEFDEARIVRFVERFRGIDHHR